jgi:hypothetical protein
LAYSSTPKIEATCSTEMSVDFQRTTWCYIAENITLRNNHCGTSNPTCIFTCSLSSVSILLKFIFSLLDYLKKFLLFRWIRGFHISGCEKLCFLGHNTVKFHKSEQRFRRKISPPSSVSNSKPSPCQRPTVNGSELLGLQVTLLVYKILCSVCTLL